MRKTASTSLLNNLVQIYFHLSRRRRLQLSLVTALVVITGGAEMISLGAVVPFLGALTNASDLLKDPQLQPIIDTLEIKTPPQLVTWLALIFCITVSIANSLRLLNMRSQFHLAAAVGSDLSCQIYQSTLMQPYSFHVRHNTSELVSSITEDIRAVSSAALPGILSLLSNSFLVLAIAISLLLINLPIALAASGILGLAYFLLLHFTKPVLIHNSHQISNLSQVLVKSLQEGWGGIRNVLLDGNQGFFEGLYRQADRPYRKAIASSAFIRVVPRFLIEATAMWAIALLAVLMAHQSQNLNQVVPILGALALGANRLLPALQACFVSISTLRTTSASLSKVLQALNRPISPNLSAPSSVSLRLHQELALQSIWFRYHETTPWVLHDLSLAIKANTTVGFVGSTGSGKSTTADLILGLLHPERGQVLVDGNPLVGKTLSAWQRSIAHVPQHIFLSDATIAENIAFGVSPHEIDWEQVRAAAQLAQIADFIESRGNGYNEIVGERGIRLSGGQRQRIGIARALYKQASVIVFDEATSALDNETEQTVMAAIERLGQQLTIILIAHRLSTVEKCDIIFELNQGTLVCSGTYKELLAKSATFRSLAMME